jgi:hypothetical protein
MVTTRRIPAKAWIAAAGALSAAVAMIGPIGATAVAATPPPTPVISGATVHYAPDNAYISLQTTLCTGCTLVVAANFGAGAAYPTGPHAPGSQRLFVENGTRVEMLRDLTTYKMSIWQRKSGVNSASPAHVSVRAGEDFFQLQPKLFTQPRGPHSLEVDYNLLGDGITEDLTTLSIYVALGHTPPGLPRKPPAGSPAWTCSVPHCPHHFDAEAVVKGLETHRHYVVSMYGFDAHGNARRGIAKGFVIGIGGYLDQVDLLGGLTSNPGGLAVDRSGGQHLLAISLTSRGRQLLTYVTRRPGEASLARRRVHGAGGPDSTFLAASVSGRSIDVVTANCRAVDVIAVPASADQLPLITSHDKVLGQHRCGDGGDGTNANPDLQAVVALAHDRVALLFDNDPQHPRTDPVQTVYIGQPGHAFTKTVLPGSVSKVAGGVMTRDPATGAVYVANAADNHINVWTLAASHQTWSQPVPAAALPADGSGTIGSIAATNGQVWVGVFRQADVNDGFSQPTPRTDGDFITHRSASGHWSPLARLPHSDPLAQGILLAANPRGGEVWELDSLVSPHGNAASGLELRRVRVGHGWSRPTRLSHWRFDDPLSLVATWQAGAAYAHQLF